MGGARLIISPANTHTVGNVFHPPKQLCTLIVGLDLWPLAHL